MNRWNGDSACSPVVCNSIAKPALPPRSFSRFMFHHLSWPFTLIATGWKGGLRDPHASEGLSWTFLITGEKLLEHVTSCTGMKCAIANLLFSPEKCLASISPEEIHNQNKMAECQTVLQCLRHRSDLAVVSIWWLSGLRRSSGKASHWEVLYCVLLLPFQSSEIYVKGCLTLTIFWYGGCIWRTDMPLGDSQLSSHLTVMIDHAGLFCGSCHIFQEASEHEFPSSQECSKELLDWRIHYLLMKTIPLQNTQKWFLPLFEIFNSGLERMPIQRRKVARMWQFTR